MNYAVPITPVPDEARPPRRWLELPIRRVPIRWRIMAIAVLNSAVALVLVAVIWDGARVLAESWTELRAARQADRLLVSLDSEAGRLQSLIHRYFTQPNPAVLSEIIRRREGLINALQAQASLDPRIAAQARSLIASTERFIKGFDDLRAVRAAISYTYDGEILGAAKEMAGLYAVLDASTKNHEASIWPALSKSRDAFNAALLAANSFYLSTAQHSGDEARRQVEIIERTIPVMLGLAEGVLQRDALEALGERAAALHRGIDRLREQFTKQSGLLSDAIDGNAAAMARATSDLGAAMEQRERNAQDRFDEALRKVNAKVALVALVFLLVVMLIGIGVARSISEPLRDLREAMRAIVAGRTDRPIAGLQARDEIGDMARAVEVFRENAVAKARAEDALRLSKEHAEAALGDLKSTQTSLIQAEKLAALGGLVAGVAHEVNNPVGISLTVASSLAHRCRDFAAEMEAGNLRRSRLAEFVESNRVAADQLVANLHRAGELIQAFKQVAVDRSHAERRRFDLKESTEQIVASLRPGIKPLRIGLIVDVPEGIVMDSYPGPLGQVLTNLFLNAATHAFPNDRAGTISIVARTSGADQVHIVFRDDGIGMSEEVQHQAFDPFFTTRRGEGGTGLGLHIAYNIVTRRLGGRIALSSAPGFGTTFRISLPLTAPRDEAEAPQAAPAALSVGV